MSGSQRTVKFKQDTAQTGHVPMPLESFDEAFCNQHAEHRMRNGWPNTQREQAEDGQRDAFLLPSGAQDCIRMQNRR